MAVKWVMASRARVVLIVLGLLLLLDLGRSIYARVGYARPVEVWQPDAAVYADLIWPPGSHLPPDTSIGRRIYEQRCAVCHGPDGRGNGPAAPSMIPRPRDFTRGQFKYKTTPAGQPPTDEDLIRVVRDGLPASAMPFWRDLLNDAEIRAVVEYVKRFSPVFREATGQPVIPPPHVPLTVESVARGRALFGRQCASCHGQDGRATPVLPDAIGYPVLTRDLTAPWTFRGGAEPDQIWRRLTIGLAPAPMPSFANSTTPEERWDLVNYVLSLARTPAWQPGGRLDGPGQSTNSVRRGRYLVHASMCGLCHTPINKTGIYRGDDFYLAGGMRVGTYPHGIFISRNLTSDAQTGLGRWTEEQIVEAMRNGRAPDRVLNLWDMPWGLLHALQDSDALAIARYLKTTLRPVRNFVPGPLHYGVVETILVKPTRELPAVNPGVLTFADGIFSQPGGGVPRTLPQQVLIVLQWIVIVVGAIAFILARPQGRRLPRGVWGWLLTILALVVVAILCLVGWALYALPMLKVIPPAQIAAGQVGGLPTVDRTAFTAPGQADLAERGRYLFNVTSCALCHLPNGAGGAKISWRPFGTLWTRNITPDADTGIGRWSDEQIARAIRSGVSADGRMLHWQGMIWDHLSNLDEEDVRALIAYLRGLPPVRRQIPPARPPAPDDCEVYSFFTVPSTTPGCR